MAIKKKKSICKKKESSKDEKILAWATQLTEPFLVNSQLEYEIDA